MRYWNSLRTSLSSDIWFWRLRLIQNNVESGFTFFSPEQLAEFSDIGSHNFVESIIVSLPISSIIASKSDCKLIVCSINPSVEWVLDNLGIQNDSSEICSI